MSSRQDHDFEGTDNKICLRKNWDRPILEAGVATRSGKLLSYFGLPGPAIQDLLDWKGLLSEITGVERLSGSRGNFNEEDLNRHRRLLRNVMISGISDRFQLLRGTIEDVILDTTDKDGNVPKLNDGRPPQHMRFAYDLVNLDLFGGISYRARNVEHRTARAIKKLFERQKGTNFVLLLTLNVRDGIRQELHYYLERTKERVDKPLKDVVAWYQNLGDGDKDYVLKAVVPLFIQAVAETNMFESHAYAPVSYIGNGRAHMVHFAFDLTHKTGSLQGFSNQRVSDLLNLPLVVIESGELKIAKRQHDGYDFNQCHTYFAFLPVETRTRLLSTIEPDTTRGERVE